METITIKITDELEDTTITSKGILDLSNGKISNIVYDNYNLTTDGVPAKNKHYEFTSGMIETPNKDIEFAIETNKRGDYSVSKDELSELKNKLNPKQSAKKNL